MKNAVFLAAVSALFALAVKAEDRTIDFGSAAVTLDADTTYGRLIVNGDLTVAAGRTLTVDSICVASNINGRATLTLEEGAKVVVNGTGASDCLFGAAGGEAEVTLQSGSSLTSAQAMMGIGYAESPLNGSPVTKTTVNLNGATLKLTDTNGGLCLGSKDYSSWPSGSSASTVIVDINLNAGSVLDVRKISHYPNRPVNINFNGGKFLPSGSPWKESLIYASWMNSSQPLNFVSVNSNPIDFSLAANHSSILSGGSAGSTIKFKGAGDLILSGKQSNQPTHVVCAKGLVYWQHTGKIIIRDPIMVLNGGEGFNSETYYTPHAFEVDAGGSLDLGGQSFTVTSMMANHGGSVTNSGNACTVTLDDAGADVAYRGKLVVPANVSLVKRGSGTLSMAEGALSNLTVQEGAVEVTGHGVVGYPFYKFHVFATGNVGGTNARVNIGELVYLDGDEDVTQGWTALYYDPTGTGQYNSPTNALDGTTETYWYDQRAQNFSTVSNIHFELEYPMPRKITGYKWTYPAGTKNYNVNPTSWAVYGSDDNTNWEQLDYVEYQAAGWTGWTRRSCTYAPSVYSISMNAGTTLKVTAADVSAAVTTASETLSLGKGATVALATGTKLSSLTIDADDTENSTIVNFDSSADGVLDIIGTAAILPRALPVALPGTANALLPEWKVNYNGTPVKYCPLIEDGMLKLRSTLGLCVIIK